MARKVHNVKATPQALAPKKGSPLFKWAQDKGYRNLFFSNAAGNLAVLTSGILEGNTGRIFSPAMGLARNIGAGAAIEALSKRFSKAAVVPWFMMIPAVTNIPMAMTAASTAEFLAATVLITGYTIKSVSGFITAHRIRKAERMHMDIPDENSKKAPKKKRRLMHSISRRVGFDPDRGKRLRYMHMKASKFKTDVADGIEASGRLMPAILLFRGSMRVLDGIIRKDPIAIGGGVAYIIGSGNMFLGDLGLKRDKEAAQDKAKDAQAKASSQPEKVKGATA